MFENINEKFFSIIIPLYNRERYICDCLQSIYDQTFQHFEVIVVDDGSSDSSKELCQEYVKNRKNCMIYSQENSGPYMARLEGIKHAKGEYLLFLDSDDKLKETALAELYETIQKENADMIMFNASLDETYTNSFIKYDFEDGAIFYDIGKEYLYELICNTTILNNLATKCIAKKLYNENDFKTIYKFCNSEDLYMVIPFIDRAEKIVYLEKNLYYYRQNAYSTTHNYNPYFYNSCKYTNERCILYAQKWGNQKYVDDAQKRAARMCIDAIVYVLLSSQTYTKKINELNKIYNDNFFKKYIKFEPNSLTIKEKFIYKCALSSYKIVKEYFLIVIGKIYIILENLKRG